MKPPVKIDSTAMTLIIETRQPRGLFYSQHANLYCACDNSTGDAWVEEFESESEAIKYLTI